MATFKINRLCALLGCCFAIAAVQSATMPKEEYTAEKTRIETDFKAARDACNSMSGNVKDICVEEAKGNEKVKRAELEYRRDATVSNQEKVAKARADATYEVAEEKCDDLAGNAKDVCIKEAKAARTKTLADAKATHKSTKARNEATDEKSDAQYKAAAEKCDALAGDAKASCISAAKARFGKS
jgi:hypothetical protein